ncbi:tRNA (adenosine(37)-N6)-threonylcarbamoyltransferase complex transferase subunit TsaD [Desulfovibrio ferrophilus]|uniref:tRNA N6-adenosine threonylcarbamoyltransferase n=1 Tax=Desulfovibrio ferrophilus TaxID=241368 RepID=A0A2Z6AX64_9BACT|nr:tRNA (adenosine(37)-N6)-threonylcarbamoyltransferase complex transferase subunit TsaD [Desulfovibrio ferrophilus]BBD07798.1 glycoprotease family metalloendopeptidase [Desulfovibrio ferrophilus]
MTLCLGIETSCDETALALVEDGRLLTERIATQVDAHALFGGVVPELASREHLRVLAPLVDSLLEGSGRTLGEVDVVAVARGPGLLGSLLVGMSFAKGLALAAGADLVGVNHLWAHLLAPALEQDIAFPALGLLVSGGHTQTYRVDSPLAFEVLGRTLDDAAGEAFDKAAKVLNLPYPGGRIIDELAQRATPDKTIFPRPYVNNTNLDFSFSGVKTAMANYVANHPHLRADRMMSDMDELLADRGERGVLEELCIVCSSFNWCIAEALRIKVDRALEQVGKDVRSLIVAGGVAANSMIRSAMTDLAKGRGLEIILPSTRLCTDNGAMIALTGWYLHSAGYRHGMDLEAIPRGRKIPWDYCQLEI